MLTRETRKKLETVDKIINLVEHIGAGTTLEQISDSVYGSDSQAYIDSVVKPMIDALVMTGRLTECKTRTCSYYYIAK